jgi:hypothetical protein
MIERAISYSIDSYDFDGIVLSNVKDMVVPGRGVARVKYVPTHAEEPMKNETGEAVMGDDKQPVHPVVYEEAPCEYVPWNAFRRGPGRQWGDVTWIAFEHYLSRKEMRKAQRSDRAAAVLWLLGGGRRANVKEPRHENLPRFGKRARVWEIWDKEERKVHFISPEYGEARIVTHDDPLELQEFFPIPRPMMAISSPDSLVPVSPYSIYVELIDELNEVTRRITRLVKQLRVRGGYAGTLPRTSRRLSRATTAILSRCKG